MILKLTSEINREIRSIVQSWKFEWMCVWYRYSRTKHVVLVIFIIVLYDNVLSLSFYF